MNKHTLIIALFVLGLTLEMCKNSSKRTEYYENGNLWKVYKVENGLKNGKCIEYYENKNKKSVTCWKNDTLSGLAKYFYINGNLKIECNWLDNNMHGEIKEYYQDGILKKNGNYFDNFEVGEFKYYNNDGQLKIIRNYIIVGNKSEVNEFYYFNSKGDTIKDKSNYFKIITNADTIKLGETIYFKFILEAPYFKDKMAVVFGAYDDKYNVLDSSTLDTLYGENFETSFNYLSEDTGTNVLRGYVADVKLESNNDSIASKERRLYFSKYFYISPR